MKSGTSFLSSFVAHRRSLLYPVFRDSQSLKLHPLLLNKLLSVSFLSTKTQPFDPSLSCGCCCHLKYGNGEESDRVSDSQACQAFLENIKSRNYFDLLNQGRIEFDLSLRDVKRKFLNLQSRFHPDNFSSSQFGEKERNSSMLVSSFLNKAYQTLKDPVLRATYILELNGDGLGEQDKTEDPEFLAEVLETLECIDECTDLQQCLMLHSQNSKKYTSCLNDLSAALKDTRNGLSQAKRCLIKLKYYKNIDEACQSSMMQLQKSPSEK